MADESLKQLLDKVDILLRDVSTLNSEIKYITDDLAHHQATLAELAQAITEIKMARATERGYIAGALAVGGLLGGLLGNLLFRQFAG